MWLIFSNKSVQEYVFLYAFTAKDESNRFEIYSLELNFVYYDYAHLIRDFIYAPALGFRKILIIEIRNSWNQY